MVQSSLNIQVREKDLEALRAVFRKHPEIEWVKLYGSRARGEAHRASDIDLAIYAPTMPLTRFARLNDDLFEAPIILEIDTTRAHDLKDDRFAARLEAEGVLIYEREG